MINEEKSEKEHTNTCTFQKNGEQKNPYYNKRELEINFAVVVSLVSGIGSAHELMNHTVHSHACRINRRRVHLVGMKKRFVGGGKSYVGCELRSLPSTDRDR